MTPNQILTPTLRGLYAITDAGISPTVSTLQDHVEQALWGGTKIIQYRHKNTNASDKWLQALELATLCHRFHATLIINDDLALALALSRAVKADFNMIGLHLGREDGSLSLARQVLGEDAIIGATCHDSLDFAAQATQQGASYLAFGRFFQSRTKPNAPAADIHILAQAKDRFKLPVVAIGGVNLDNAPQLIKAGADMVAVVEAVFTADNISDTCRQFQTLFQ